MLLVSLVVYGMWSFVASRDAGERSGNILDALVERRGELHEPERLEELKEHETMPAELVGAYAYIGTISLPSLGLELPVASETDDEQLLLSPCRYQGSYYTNDLVICGQGFSSHFGTIESLGIRDEVTFVNVDGEVYHYIVSNVETDRIEDIDKIIDDWDLTLFTFNVGGTCGVVRCVRT